MDAFLILPLAILHIFLYNRGVRPYFIQDTDKFPDFCRFETDHVQFIVHMPQTNYL